MSRHCLACLVLLGSITSSAVAEIKLDLQDSFDKLKKSRLLTDDGADNDFKSLLRALEDDRVAGLIKRNFEGVPAPQLYCAIWIEVRKGPKALPMDKPITVASILPALNGTRVCIYFESDVKEVEVFVDGQKAVDTNQSYFVPKDEAVRVVGKKDGYKDFSKTETFKKNGRFKIDISK